jgi:hypothetical protein
MLAAALLREVEVATALATWSLASDCTSLDQSDDGPDLTSGDTSRQHPPDGLTATRNRKVVGSNPTSGSQTRW